MPFKKGHKKFGGRKRGTPNKASLAALDIASSLNFNPFEILCHIAQNNWEALGYSSATVTRFSIDGSQYEVPIITMDHRLRAAADAVEYLMPRRKPIEFNPEKEAREANLENATIELTWDDTEV